MADMNNVKNKKPPLSPAEKQKAYRARKKLANADVEKKAFFSVSGDMIDALDEVGKRLKLSRAQTVNKWLSLTTKRDLYIAESAKNSHYTPVTVLFHQKHLNAIQKQVERLGTVYSLDELNKAMSVMLTAYFMDKNLQLTSKAVQQYDKSNEGVELATLQRIANMEGEGK